MRPNINGHGLNGYVGSATIGENMTRIFCLLGMILALGSPFALENYLFDEPLVYGYFSAIALLFFIGFWSIQSVSKEKSRLECQANRLTGRLHDLETAKSNVAAEHQKLENKVKNLY